jgi:S-(hydroxymethyl)glutathione dehydrogenase/alcohol dehydrogenase
VSQGDHVLTSYQPACGLCRYCTVGRPNLCDLRTRPRNVMWDGSSRFANGTVNHFFQISSHSEYAVVPEECLITVRKDAPLDVICLVSCGVATGAGAVMNRANVTPGATVVVIGCGGVGLNAIQAARLSGAGNVIAVDVHEFKLEAAREFGATHTLDAADLEACAAAVRDISGGEGADVSIEAVGIESTMEFAFSVLRRGGRAVIAGVARDGARIQVDPRLLLQERELTGTSFGGARQRVDLPTLVDLYMAGRFKLDELISERVELEDINGAYDRMKRGEIKRDVLVFPW